MYELLSSRDNSKSKSSHYSSVTNKDNEVKQHFMNDENFKKLRHLQQELLLVTEVMPSLRKIINVFITEENVRNYKENFIQQFNV